MNSTLAAPVRFSVVTPSFRSGAWLRLCSASVADQNVSFEHIVQDGGSKDGSLDCLPPNPRLKLFVEKDQGMYDAINRGLRRAQGDILGYLNCDEQYLPGALAAVGEFFDTHPTVDVVFGNVIVTDPEGRYLWHRKMLPPRLGHTWTCPLSTLTCATFFRRRVLDQEGVLFDSRWKVCGDSAWMLELLKRRISMAALSQFTSVFTHTGSNLSLDPRAAEEARAFYATAPKRLLWARPVLLLQHRIRRWVGGCYRQQPFDYSIYTQSSPESRVTQHVPKPSSRWRW